MKKTRIVQWEEMKDTNPERDGITKKERELYFELIKHHGYGPRFHPRFSDAKVVNDSSGILTLQKEVRDASVAQDIIDHISSWRGNFHVKII